MIKEINNTTFVLYKGRNLSVNDLIDSIEKNRDIDPNYILKKYKKTMDYDIRYVSQEDVVAIREIYDNPSFIDKRFPDYLESDFAMTGFYDYVNYGYANDLLLGYLYRKYKEEMFKHVCFDCGVAIYDFNSRSMIIGVLNNYDSNISVGYGFLDGDVIVSNNHKLLYDFCNLVYKVDDNTYVKDFCEFNIYSRKRVK